MNNKNTDPIGMDDFSKELHKELMHVGKIKLNEVLEKHCCPTDKELLNTMMGENAYFLRIIPQMFADVDLYLNNNEKRKALITDLFRSAEFYQTKKICVSAKALLLELIINFTQYSVDTYRTPKRPFIHLSNADIDYLVRAICPRSKCGKSRTLQRYFKNLEDAGFLDKKM